MQNSLKEIADQYDTDKNDPSGYLDNYTQYFSHLREQPIRLLEIGVYRGGSLLMWNDFFPNGRIIGIDIKPNPLQTTPNQVQFYQASQDDESALERIAQHEAPEGFDIIIDDAAHIGNLARRSFAALFSKYLKSGGIYVIEDWGTGYWGTWPDGHLYHPHYPLSDEKYSSFKAKRARIIAKLASIIGYHRMEMRKNSVDPDFSAHNFGMVGFVKELIDHVAWGDITRAGHGNPQAHRAYSRIEKIAIHPGQVFVFKA